MCPQLNKHISWRHWGHLGLCRFHMSGIKHCNAMCFYTVTKLKLKTLTVAKLSGQRWVWQRRCFGLEIIIHHCRMSCCSQKHQHRHCRQKRCKRKKENNVENILNIKYIDDLFLLYAFFSFPNKFLPLLLSFIHKKKNT